MADTPPGETVTPEAPSNGPSTPAAPSPVNTVDTGEIERLRKEAEQATLRANQLANEKQALLDAEAARKAKELEETSQYKTLYEQEKAERERIQAEKEADAKRAELKSEADKIFADYSPEVRKLADTTGLSLSDTDAATVAAFKAKLDEVKSMVGAPRVNSSNPANPTPHGPTVEDADGVVKKPLEADPNKLDEIFRSMPGIASMMGPTQE